MRQLADSVNRIGVFGGSFDPFHNAHLAVIRFVLDSNIADTVFVVPAGNPRLRTQALQASALQRLEMIKIALKCEDSRIHISVDDIIHTGISTTANLLQRLRTIWGSKNHWLLILGSDAAKRMDNWVNPYIVLSLANLIVIERPNEVSDTQIKCIPKEHPAYTAQYFKGPMKNISANMVRHRVYKEQEFESLVAPGVAEYIKKEGLYKKVITHE